MVLLASIAGLPACATYRVQVASPDPLNEAKYEGGTMHALFWGLWKNPIVAVAEDRGAGINDIEVRQHFGHALVSVLTLGVYMPMKVVYRVKAPAGSVNDFE
jgi:hypothetical protein